MEADMQLVLALSSYQEGSDDEFLFADMDGVADLSLLPDMDEALALALSMEDCDVGCVEAVEQGKYGAVVGGGAFEKTCNNDTSSDHVLAALLHAKLETERRESLFCGKAWDFVQEILDVQKRMLTSTDPGNTSNAARAIRLEPIGTDDMLYTTERLMETQAEFGVTGKATLVDIGYHYTRSSNLKHIKTNGLMNKAERSVMGVEARHNGSTWGDGIYTSSNPFAFTGYGDTGLLVARLFGNTGKATRGAKRLAFDTAIANSRTGKEMMILRKCCQCIPLFQFKRPKATDANIAELDRAIWDAHGRLQQVVDVHLNAGASKATRIPFFQRSTLPAPRGGVDPLAGHVRQDSRPRLQQTPRQQSYPLPPTQAHSSTQRTTPPSSPDPADPRAYGRSETLQRGKRIYNTHSGYEFESMRVLRFRKEELCCDGTGTLTVVYSFFKSPGETRHRSALTHRVSYHPDTTESKHLLERLKVAFCTEMIAVTTWQNLPHRTSPYLSCKGHLVDCHKALDCLDFAAVSPLAPIGACATIAADRRSPQLSTGALIEAHQASAMSQFKEGKRNGGPNPDPPSMQPPAPIRATSAGLACVEPLSAKREVKSFINSPNSRIRQVASDDVACPLRPDTGRSEAIGVDTTLRDASTCFEDVVDKLGGDKTCPIEKALENSDVVDPSPAVESPKATALLDEADSTSVPNDTAYDGQLRVTTASLGMSKIASSPAPLILDRMGWGGRAWTTATKPPLPPPTPNKERAPIKPKRKPSI